MDSRSPKKLMGFLLTEVAMGLLDYKFFDLDGLPVDDLQTLTKLKLNANDYSKSEVDLFTKLKIPKNSFYTTNDSYKNTVDTIDFNERSSVHKMRLNFVPAKSHTLKNQSIEKIDGNKLYVNNIKKLPNIHFKQKRSSLLHNNNSSSTIQKKTYNETESLQAAKNEPNFVLSKSRLRSDRVKYLKDLTRFEFFKMKQTAKQRRKNFIKNQDVINGKSVSEYYKQEKKIYESESDALLSFIKVVKKSEFPADNPKLHKLVSQISGDIMEAKKVINNYLLLAM